MTFQQFKDALKVGADTSGERESVTGAHGYGMKEAAWAFKQAKVITIQKNRYTTRLFWWDELDVPVYEWDDENGIKIIDILLI